MSILVMLPRCLDDGSFIVIYEVKQGENFKYVFLFLNCLGYSNPLYASKRCRITGCFLVICIALSQ